MGARDCLFNVTKWHRKAVAKHKYLHDRRELKATQEHFWDHLADVEQSPQTLEVAISILLFYSVM